MASRDASTEEKFSALTRWSLVMLELDQLACCSHKSHIAELILGLCPANESSRYKVTPFLIGWAQTSNQSCIGSCNDLLLNTMRPRQKGWNYADDIFMFISLKEKFLLWWIFLLKYAHKDPINNKSISIQIMVWDQSGDKPLSELMTT